MCVDSLRMWSRIIVGVAPWDRALALEAWMTGPSAIGSENGIPTSSMSAPPSTRAAELTWNDSGDGSPPVRYATRAPSSFSWSSLNFLPMALSLGEIFGSCLHVLVSSTRQVHDDSVVG